MPDQVFATIDYGKYYDIEVDDDVSVMMRYNNGTIGIYTTSTGEYPGTNRLEISCDKAKIVIENGKLSMWKYPVSEKEYRYYCRDDFKAMECEYSEYIPEESDSSAHNQILQNFVNAVLFGEELISPGYDGIKGLSISNAIHLSDWTKKTVSLPIDSDEHERLLMEKVKSSKSKSKIVIDDSIKAGKASSRWEVKW